MSNRNYTDFLKCSKETKDQIMNDCVAEYLKHHPEHDGLKITQGFMLKRLSEYYLGDNF